AKAIISGTFKIGSFEIQAQNVMIAVHADQGIGTLQISGTVVIPLLGKNFTLELGDGGDGGGLTIDFLSGQWKLNGWKLVLPTIPIPGDAVTLENVTVGFSGNGNKAGDAPSNWQLELAGTLRILGKAWSANLVLGEHQGVFFLSSLGAEARGLNPG